MFTTKNLLILIARNVLISLAFVAVSIFLIFFIINKIETITDRIVLNHKLEVDLKNRTALLTTLESDITIIGENDVLIDSAFVPSNNISKFMSVLDSLASKNKITQKYQFDTPTPSGSLGDFSTSTISYSNNLTTNISTFGTYLKDFEKIPYFTKIEGFSISSQDKTGWNGPSVINIKATLLTQTIQ